MLFVYLYTSSAAPLDKGYCLKLPREAEEVCVLASSVAACAEGHLCMAEGHWRARRRACRHAGYSSYFV